MLRPPPHPFTMLVDPLVDLEKTNQHLIPGSSRVLEMRMIGAILSSMAFTGSCIMGVACILSLLRNKRHQDARCNFRSLVAYVAIMVSISIFSEVESILSLISFTFRGFPFFVLKSGSPASLPLAVWGADGFMLWRCVVLYRGVSRFTRIAVYSTVVFLAVKALVVGILVLTPVLGFMSSIILIAFTTAINLIILFLTIFRLIRYQVYLRKASEEGDEAHCPYSLLMAMWTESSALIVVVGIVCIIAAIGNPNNADAVQIPLQLMPHICVISPLLIIYRVSEGKAATVTATPQSTAIALEPLQFASNQSTTESA